jgi:glutaminyl-tRNA synthetase
MKNGDYPEGSHVLRAKIDMSSANMRDPLMYRVLHRHHHRTGTTGRFILCMIFAHESDYIKISHSICTPCIGNI